MKRLFVLCALCGLSAAASAATWTIAPGSTLDFDTSFEQAPLHGKFEHFSGRITLDPKHPNACSFDVTINPGSAKTGNPTGDTQIRSTPFFDIAHYPQAIYRATQCRWNGKGPIEVLGTLTLRGVSKAVPLHAELHNDGKTATLDAQATVNRLDFGVGQGQWASASIISKTVTIKAHLLLMH
ncbi:YceI family protein [Acidihalobacter ferrooxydans]|uniref:Lipid/polyisoprenoid-binding YceI-like domain-containing protein n=1 Tax=Acidihalobacter ferrooxydans TaxID=1765967 RepID=A0A1P8UHU3_9GAMM|nr:YceI family protein [Acidihalobacter ferrooxydans]APZ43416.1 hypothetical protein BW247_10200 [Acidihalobacter ferrooxydans]